MASREENDAVISTRASHAGRRVIVTGAGNGIGRGIALAFARRGANVGVADLRAEDVERTLAEIREGALGGGVALAVDDFDAVEHTVRSAEASIRGAFDTVVNNAGISPKHDGRAHRVYEMDPVEWRHVVDVNLTRVFTRSACSRPRCATMAAAGSSTSPRSRARPIRLSSAATTRRRSRR